TGVEKISPLPTVTVPPGVTFEGVETPFTPAVSITTDVECDSVSFASGANASVQKDALWARNGNQLVALELPGGTCGFHDGPLVLAPGACLLRDPGTGVLVKDATGRPVQNLADVAEPDGDALLDCWEDGTVWLNNEPCPGCTKDGKPGIDLDGDGVRDLVLCDNNNPASPGVCASKTHKDVFVEI